MAYRILARLLQVIVSIISISVSTEQHFLPRVENKSENSIAVSPIFQKWAKYREWPTLPSQSNQIKPFYISEYSEANKTESFANIFSANNYSQNSLRQDLSLPRSSNNIQILRDSHDNKHRGMQDLANYINPGVFDEYADFLYTGAGQPLYYQQNNMSLTDNEDKQFTRTVAATNILKFGSIVFVFFMALVVIIVAQIGSSAGVALSPLVLLIGLVPLGITAAILAVPLSFVLGRLLPTGEGDHGRRKSKDKKSHVDESLFFHNILSAIEQHK